MPSKCFCCVHSHCATAKHVLLERELVVAVSHYFGSSCGIRSVGDHLRGLLASW